MSATATHDEIVRLFPGMQDHAVLEIEAINATVGELEAALLAMQQDDEALIEFRRQSGDRLNRLLAILTDAGIEPQEDY